MIIDGNFIRGSGASISIDGGCASCTGNTNTYNVVVTNNIIKSGVAPSYLDLTGGTYGLVQNVTVQGNIFNGASGTTSVITTDSHTTNVNSANNLMAP
jgi:hypothetical protein